MPRKAANYRVSLASSGLPGTITLLLACALLGAACTDKDPGGEPSAPATTVPSVSDTNVVDPPNLVPIAEGNVALPQPPLEPIVPSSPNVVASPNLVTVAHPNLRLVGRLITDDANGPIMSWPGSKIIAGFTGRSLTLNMRTVDQQNYPGIGNVDNYIQVTIDGKATNTVRILQGQSAYVLATGLLPGNHTVEVTKRTEAQIGSLQFLGFTLEAGAQLAPGPAPLTRRLEFIGDSGATGYGADGNWAATHCSFTPATQNAPAAYPMVAGALLNADVHVTSFSGKGIYQNRDTINDSYLTLPVLWTMTSADSYFQPPGDAAKWNPANFIADAVVVIVGGNDFAASTPSPSAYNGKAVAFLKALRAAYAQARIYVAISPMLDPAVDGESKPSSGELGMQYAKAMVASMADPKVTYLPLTLDDGSRGVGCDYHMNVATHKVYGQTIATAIAKDLGW